MSKVAMYRNNLLPVRVTREKHPELFGTVDERVGQMDLWFVRQTPEMNVPARLYPREGVSQYAAFGWPFDGIDNTENPMYQLPRGRYMWLNEASTPDLAKYRPKLVTKEYRPDLFTEQADSEFPPNSVGAIVYPAAIYGDERLSVLIGNAGWQIETHHATSKLELHPDFESRNGWWVSPQLWENINSRVQTFVHEYGDEGRVTELEAKVQGLEEQVRDANLRRVRAESALDDLKDRAGRRAMALAREHGWCGVVQDALYDLDIPVPPYRVTFTVTKTWTVTADYIGSYDMDESTIRDGLRMDVPSMDGDWEDVFVHDDDGRIEIDHWEVEEDA